MKNKPILIIIVSAFLYFLTSCFLGSIGFTEVAFAEGSDPFPPPPDSIPGGDKSLDTTVVYQDDSNLSGELSIIELIKLFVTTKI